MFLNSIIYAAYGSIPVRNPGGFLLGIGIRKLTGRIAARTLFLVESGQ
jgi:hypothetical protein